MMHTSIHSHFGIKLVHRRFAQLQPALVVLAFQSKVPTVCITVSWIVFFHYRSVGSMPSSERSIFSSDLHSRSWMVQYARVWKVRLSQSHLFQTRQINGIIQFTNLNSHRSIMQENRWAFRWILGCSHKIRRWSVDSVRQKCVDVELLRSNFRNTKYSPVSRIPHNLGNRCCAVRQICINPYWESLEPWPLCHLLVSKQSRHYCCPWMLTEFRHDLGITA